VETRFRSNTVFQVNELTLALPLKPGRFWAGLSASPRLDFHYEAENRVYNSSGAVKTLSRTGDGGALWAVTPSVAAAFTENFSLGLSYDFLFGSEKLSVFQVDTSTSGGFTGDLRESADYRGGALRGGLRWRATEKIALGFAYQPAYRLARDYDFVNSTSPASSRSGSDKWDMPAQWSAGFSYRPGDEHDTELVAEIRQTDWSSTKINGRPVNGEAFTKPILRETGTLGLFGLPAPSARFYSDVTELHVGVEHGVTPQWAVRYGFYTVPFFADRGVESTFFTLGAGYDPDETWSWSAAAEFGKRDYKGENLLFPATRRADETFRRILLSGRMRW
jgi:long-subunit fatty acid transport protein